MNNFVGDPLSIAPTPKENSQFVFYKIGKLQTPLQNT